MAYNQGQWPEAARAAGEKPKGCDVLTESEVARSWTNLFKNNSIDDQTLRRAEGLLNELRMESPLWHRLSSELDELRVRLDAARPPTSDAGPEGTKPRRRKRATSSR